MVNGANIDTEENRSKSAAYENGEEISFANNQEALDWGGYYARQYRFANEDAPGFKRATGPQTRQTKWKVQWENVAERENACKQKVLDTYGTVDGCTRLAKVMQAVHKLDDGTVYDETYVYADLNTAIERKKMVCWHFFVSSAPFYGNLVWMWNAWLCKGMQTVLIIACCVGKTKTTHGIIRILPCTRKQNRTFIAICHTHFFRILIIRRKEPAWTRYSR